MLGIWSVKCEAGNIDISHDPESHHFIIQGLFCSLLCPKNSLNLIFTNTFKSLYIYPSIIIRIDHWIKLSHKRFQDFWLGRAATYCEGAGWSPKCGPICFEILAKGGGSMAPCPPPHPGTALGGWSLDILYLLTWKIELLIPPIYFHFHQFHIINLIVLMH